MPGMGQRDRFGNLIDEAVGYARGGILATNADEISRMHYARSIVRRRVISLGEGSVFDLSGLPRSFHLEPEDLPKLRSQAAFCTYLDNTAEEQAVRFMGGNPLLHEALFVNRVTSGLLAISLALLSEGDAVLSLVALGRSHPSIQRTVELAGATFIEASGIDSFEARLREVRPRMTIASPVTAAKHHLLPRDLSRFVSLSKEAGAIVFVDDAHMASRLGFYGDPPPFQSGPIDLAIFSTDKHIVGPRTGVIVGGRDLLRSVRAKAMEFGLEAQTGQYAAAGRAIRHHEADPVRRAGTMAEELLSHFESGFGRGRFYLAGPGVAISGEDALLVAMERSGKPSPAITPMEAASVVSNHMLSEHGVLTIGSLSMPGTAPIVSLMMFPDGARLGRPGVTAAVESGLARLGELLDSVDEARLAILGPSA